MMKKRLVFLVGAWLGVLVSLSAAQTLRGVITDAITKEPVDGATITIYELDKSFVSRGDGIYFTDTLKAGTYNVRVEANGFLKATKKVILSSPKGGGASDLECNIALYAIKRRADTSEGMMTVKYCFPGHRGADIEIRNKDNKVVRKAYDRSRTGGMRTFSWDGKDNHGNPLPAGRYSCKVVSGRLVMIRTLYWKGKEKPPAPAATPRQEVEPVILDEPEVEIQEAETAQATEEVSDEDKPEESLPAETEEADGDEEMDEEPAMDEDDDDSQAGEEGEEETVDE